MSPLSFIVLSHSLRRVAPQRCTVWLHFQYGQFCGFNAFTRFIVQNLIKQKFQVFFEWKLTLADLILLSCILSYHLKHFGSSVLSYSLITILSSHFLCCSNFDDRIMTDCFGVKKRSWHISTPFTLSLLHFP